MTEEAESGGGGRAAGVDVIMHNCRISTPASLVPNFRQSNINSCRARGSCRPDGVRQVAEAIRRPETGRCQGPLQHSIETAVREACSFPGAFPHEAMFRECQLIANLQPPAGELDYVRLAAGRPLKSQVGLLFGSPFDLAQSKNQLPLVVNANIRRLHI